MRLLFIFLIIFSSYHSFGQKLAKEMNAWDSLYSRTLAEEKRHDEILRKELFFTDTLKVKNQIIITYYAFDKRKLRKMSNNLDTDGCIRGMSYEYYNSKELIEFQTPAVVRGIRDFVRQISLQLLSLI